MRHARAALLLSVPLLALLLTGCQQTGSLSGIPSIQAFAATPNPAPAGSSVTLEWSSSGNAQVRLTGSHGARFDGLEPKGSLTVTPSQDTTYTLALLTGSATLTSKTATVSIANTSSPIQTLSAPASTDTGSTYGVSWQVSSAPSQDISLFLNDHQVADHLPATGSHDLTAALQANHYDFVRLDVQRGGVVSTRTVVVQTALAKVAIDHITLTPSGPVPPNTPVTIAWRDRRQNDGVTLQPDDIQLGPGVHQVTVTPTYTTTYTLHVSTTSALGGNAYLDYPVTVTTTAPARIAGHLDTLDGYLHAGQDTSSLLAQGFLPNDPFITPAAGLLGETAGGFFADGALNAWYAFHPQRSITIAYLGGGVEVANPDLHNARVLPGYDFCGDSTCSTTDPDVTPDPATDEHYDTNNVGILAATVNNQAGTAAATGPAGSVIRVQPLKVEDASLSRTTAITEALSYAAGQPVTLPNGSTITDPTPANIVVIGDPFLGPNGSGADSTALHDAFAQLNAQHVLIISDPMNVTLLGSILTGVTVLAPGHSNDYTLHADTPGTPPFLAPADFTTWFTDPTTAQGFPVAFTTATAAMVMAQDPSLDDTQTISRLENTAYHTSDMSPAWGHGLLRADLALGAVGPGTSVTIEVTDPHGNALASNTVTLRADAHTPFHLDVPNYQGAATFTATAVGANGQTFALHDPITLAPGTLIQHDFPLLPAAPLF